MTTSVVDVAINASSQHAGGGTDILVESRGRSWQFTPVPAPSLDQTTVEHIDKWGLSKCIRTSRFSFDKKFQAYDSTQFLECVFADQNVQREVEVCSGRGAWMPLQALGNNMKVQHEAVGTTWVNLEPLMRFKGGAVRENDMIIKCFDEAYDGIVVSDELRKAFLAGEDSDFYEEFSDEDRGELLYRLLGHVVVGGSLCQYEDTFQPYVDAVRQIYKSLVRVVRNDNTQLAIVSYCYKVCLTPSKKEGPLNSFYPNNRTDHPQDFCYVCVDPIKRYVTVLYGAWDD